MLGIVVGALALPQGAAFAIKAVQDVLVTNGPDQPIPTKAVGTEKVQIEGTPQVNVGNTPGVNVANKPDVNVANTPSVEVASPVPVGKPISLRGSDTTSNPGAWHNVTGSHYYLFAHLDIPSGKSLVATQLGSQVSVPRADCSVESVLVRRDNDTLTWHVPQKTGRVTWLASDQISLAGLNRVQAEVVCPNTSEPLEGSASLSAVVSGFLVDE